jgi:general L-amino acid transport system substrate-binding protein
MGTKAMMRIGLFVVAVLAVAPCRSAHAAGVLDAVRARGSLTCGVVTEETDYTKFDTHGGLDDIGGEICKAVAVAVLGDKAQTKSTNFPDEQTAFKALAAGKIDLLAGATPTASNSTLYGVTFGPPIFIDGQGFMVRRDSGIKSLRDLGGKQVCFVDDTEIQRQLEAAAREQGIKILPYPWSETGEMDAGLVSGHCAAMTGDVSMLAEQRAAFHARKNDFVILRQTITLDPLAPAVRQGDAQWAAIVTWTVEALLQAEASGITQANVEAIRKSDDPAIRRLLGTDRAAASALGLADDWVVQVIRSVGNYGELFARSVGPGTEYDLARGQNALWKDGGMLYPLPLR